jgi:hypothetical protein
MPEIGATLREARMRARIDISEIEAQTKIRAKYLRALENEEWDLLPGPTYVKSFLRTYADALHLDGKRLVEEYKLQHERLSDVDLQPIAPPGSRLREPRGRFGRAWIAVAVVVVALGAFWYLGTRGGDDEGGEQPASATTTTPQTTPQEDGGRRERGKEASGGGQERERKPRRIRLQIATQAPVYVCLEADGEPVINQQVLEAGTTTETFRARRFDVTLGNGAAIIRVNGREFDVPDSSEPLGYRFTARGRTELSEERRPTCGA